MRDIIVTTFMSLDGVLQAPGALEEDSTNGFAWGGWQFPFSDQTTDQALGQIMSKPFDLLLGRRTYEIFAAHWPYQNDAIAGLFNKINKYVVGTSSFDASWQNSFVISQDVVEELKQLKSQDGPDLLVHGSSVLVQTLLANKLVDVLHLFIYPLTLGKGKKLFESGTPAQGWQLTKSSISEKGVLLLTYIPGGPLARGSFSSTGPSARELERREKWLREEAG